MKKIAISILIILFSVNIFPQGTDPRTSKVIPPSPETAALFRVEDISVNHTTGVPDISIPIYTIQAGSLKLPIYISYNAEGRKVTDVTGPVGLGWSLNAGGMVSRTIFGRDDFQSSVQDNLKTAAEIDALKYDSTKDQYSYLSSLYGSGYSVPNGIRGGGDSQYDIFSYTTPTCSGKFIYYKSSYLPFSMEQVKISGGNRQLSIVDETGIEYKFAGGENTTTWKLESIESPDKKNKITFKYKYVKTGQASSGYREASTVSSLIVKDGADVVNKGSEGAHVVEPISPDYANSNFSTAVGYTAERISEIDFGYGKVIMDLNDSIGTVSAIKITNTLEEVVKQFVFEQSLLKGESYNYKLDKLSCIAEDGLESEVYQFDYSSSSNPNAYNCDYWGYKNNSTHRSDMDAFPQFRIDVYGRTSQITVGSPSGEANRKSNENKMKEGILERIIYPTGAKREFTYEQNMVLVDNNIVPGSGLRIQKIMTIENKDTLVRTYQYPSYGSLHSFRLPKYSGEESLSVNIKANNSGYDEIEQYDGFIRSRAFTSNISKDHAFITNEPIMYSWIVEYLGDINKNTGKIVYNYAFPYIGTAQRYSSPSYPSFSPAPSKNMPASFPHDSYSVGAFIASYRPWMKRNLLSQKVYKYNDATNDYELLKETNYQYKEIKKQTIHALKIQKYISCPNDGDYRKEYVLATKGYPIFLYADQELIIGKELLESVTEKEYRDNQTIVTTKQYEYNDKCYLKNTIVTNSTGKTITESLQYPFDDKYKNMDIYKKMINLNMINIPIEQAKITNSSTESMITEYKDFGNNLIRPSKFKIKEDDNPEEIRMEYHNYDEKGNPLYVSKDDVDKTVYLWGYKGQYPVAEIKNTTYDDTNAALGVTPESLTNHLTIDSIKIEGLRTKPALTSSHISSFYYNPLIGLRKVIDPQGNITYYEYDAHGRLSTIKDTQGNVMGSYNYNYAYTPIQARLEVNNHYYVNETKDINLYISGGSGNYSCNWYIKDDAGYISRSSENTGTRFTVNFNGMKVGGQYTLICQIKDIRKGKTLELTKSFEIKAPAIEFQNVKVSGNILTATIYSYESTRVTFELGLSQDRSYPGTFAHYTIGGSTWGRNSTGTQIQTVELRGSYDVKIDLTKDPSSGTIPASAWITIKSISGSNLELGWTKTVTVNQ